MDIKCGQYSIAVPNNNKNKLIRLCVRYGQEHLFFLFTLEVFHNFITMFDAAEILFFIFF